MKKKTLFFRSLTELKDGAQVDLGNFQTIVMKNNDNGELVPHVLDMSLVEEKDESVMALDPKPGTWMLSSKNALVKLDIKDVKYFETETYEEISNHFRKFRDKIDTVYKRRGLLAKRSFLLGSSPGCGKSSLINKFITEIKDEEGMCIIRIDSSNIDYDDVLTALTLSKQDKISFLILVIEDIGGTSLHERSNRVDGALLNMLDGNQDVFKVPTLVIATTNYLDLLDKTLTNRPGRFDFVYEVPPPKDSELIWLMEQFLEREMTKEEKAAVSGKKINPAYGKEIVIRSEVYDITIEEAAKQILEQRDKATSGSYHKEKTTMGFGDDID